MVEDPSANESIDIELAVTDPYTLEMSPRNLPRRVVVVNGPLPPHKSEEDIRQQLATESPVVFVRSDLALGAIDILSRSAHLPAASRDRVEAVTVFQRDFLLSGVGRLKSIVQSLAPFGTDLRSDTARVTALGAAKYAQDVISQDRETTRAVSKVISELDRNAKQAVSRARHLSAVNRGVDGAVVEGGVQYAMSQAKSGLDTILSGRYSWIGLLLRARADDVSPELTGYVETSFGRDLETAVRPAVESSADCSSYSKAVKCLNCRNISTRSVTRSSGNYQQWEPITRSRRKCCRTIWQA